MLVGPPKAGKSWLILGLALAVSGATTALGSIAIDQTRPVLMLALEDGRRRFQTRCRTILGPSEPIPPLLNVVTKINPNTVFKDVERWLAENEDQKPLVVLDTLGKIMPPSVAGESAYQRDYRIGSDIKRLTDDCPGSSFISIHHDRKADSNDFVDAASGTKGLTGAADTIIVLERDRNSNDAILNVTGRDVHEDQYALTSANGIWRLDGNSLDEASLQSTSTKSKHGVGDLSQQIIDFIAENQPVTGTQIKDRFGNSAKSNLSRLASKGRVIRAGLNEYVMPGGQRNPDAIDS